MNGVKLSIPSPYPLIMKPSWKSMCFNFWKTCTFIGKQNIKGIFLSKGILD